MSDFVRLPLCPDEFRARILTTVTRVPKPSTLREPETAYAVTNWALGGPQKCHQPPHTTHGQTATDQSAQGAPSHALYGFSSAKPLKSKASRGAERQSLQSATANNARHQQANQLGSFRDAKNSLVSNFERTYITQALIKHSGNIAMAARASNKHRRAFWALMRKHEIAAEPYRADDEE